MMESLTSGRVRLTIGITLRANHDTPLTFGS